MTGSIILRSVGTFARFSARNFVRSGTSGVLGTIDSQYTKSSMQIRSSTFSASVVVTTPRGNWVAAILPRLRDWRTAIERTPTCALAVRRLSRWGRIGVSNFCRAFEAAGKPSSLSRVKLCQEPTSSVFHRFQFSPVQPSAVAHERNHRRRSGQGVVR